MKPLHAAIHASFNATVQVAARAGGSTLATLASLLPLATVAAATDAAPGADSAGLSYEWLAPTVTVGRNEMQIARFRADQSPQALLDDATAHWRERPAPILRKDEGGWLVAVQADGEWIETVRVHADDGGAGGLRVRQRLAPRQGVEDALQIERLLPQARVVNRTDQPGGGRSITSWVLVSPSSPGQLLARARSEALRDGYLEDLSRGSAGAQALWLRRRSEELVITTSAGLDGSVAVVHWSRKP